MRSLTVGSLMGVFLGLVVAQGVQAGQFSYLDPAYQQEIYTGPLATGWGPGFSWDNSGHMLLRGNNVLYEYSATANTTVNGTSVHGYTAHSVAGLGIGFATVNGLDGYVYATSSSGLQRIDLNTWSATTLAGTAGGYYGVGSLPDGRIAYSDMQRIYVYNPVSGTNTLIYDAGAFVDQISVTNTGEIFLAVLGANRIDVISSAGALVNSFATSLGSPDGMAFGGGYAYSNNTNGTISRYSFAGPGYTGAVTQTLFASGGAYGDLASVGPDGALYVSQWGTINWANGVPTYSSAVIRISLNGATGGGGFDTGGTGFPRPSVPEPGTIALVATGLMGMVFFRKSRP